MEWDIGEQIQMCYMSLFKHLFKSVNSVIVINMITSEMFSDFKCTITHQARAEKTKNSRRKTPVEPHFGDKVNNTCWICDKQTSALKVFIFMNDTLIFWVIVCMYQI